MEECFRFQWAPPPPIPPPLWETLEQILGSCGRPSSLPPHPPVGKTLLMKAPLSTSQSVSQSHFFSKTAGRIFVNFHTNLGLHDAP